MEASSTPVMFLAGGQHAPQPRPAMHCPALPHHLAPLTHCGVELRLAPLSLLVCRLLLLALLVAELVHRVAEITVIAPLGMLSLALLAARVRRESKLTPRQDPAP